MSKPTLKLYNPDELDLRALREYLTCIKKDKDMTPDEKIECLKKSQLKLYEPDKLDRCVTVEELTDLKKRNPVCLAKLDPDPDSRGCFRMKDVESLTAYCDIDNLKEKKFPDTKMWGTVCRTDGVCESLINPEINPVKKVPIQQISDLKGCIRCLDDNTSEDCSTTVSYPKQEMIDLDSQEIPKRGKSRYDANQGPEGTCMWHGTSRLLARLIKVRFHEYFLEGNGNERINEYYNTINCGKTTTIFECIINCQQQYIYKFLKVKDPSFSDPQKISWDDLYMKYKTNKKNSIIDWDSESLSAILFHSIYATLKPINNKSKDFPHTIFDNLFTEILYYEVDDTYIKALLRYTQANLRANNRAGFTRAQQVMFGVMIAKVVDIFNTIRTGLKNKTFTPERFRSCELHPFKSVYYDHDIPKVKPDIENGDYTFSDVLETIKMVTSHGFYVLLILHHHVVLITETNKDDLIIKNSWGPFAGPWKAGDINLTEYGVLKWKTLVNYLKYPPPRESTWSPILIDLIFIVPFRFKLPKPTAEPTAKLTANPTSELTTELTSKLTAESTSEPTAKLTSELTTEPTAGSIKRKKKSKKQRQRSQQRQQRQRSQQRQPRQRSQQRQQRQRSQRAKK